ncbi:MAG: HPP family protein [Mariprofundus sp.]|nr:HPP family protein [Mariprofundus sp.]
MTKLLTELSPRQSQQEIAISSSGAVIGIGLVAWVSYHLVDSTALPFIVASMGAAAVLLYAAPHSPLTRPWSFVGGHLVSAAVGVTCAAWIPDLFLASGLAVGLAIFAMHQLNCLHPPGGAAALVAVIGGDQIQSLGYLYVLIPVGLNVLILGGAVWLTRVLLAQRRQAKAFIPYPADTHEEYDLPNTAPFSNDDLTSALQEINTYIDVTIEDLNDIYTRAISFAHQRSLGTMVCRDIMTHQVITVEFGDSLRDAWTLMQQHNIKSLPVISRVRRVNGIITVSDFKLEAAQFPGGTIEERLKTLIKPTSGMSSNKAEVVGQLMVSPVITLPEDAHVSEAVSIFTAHGISHIPILNHERRLAGMLSRTDVAHSLRSSGTA